MQVNLRNSVAMFSPRKPYVCMYTLAGFEPDHQFLSDANSGIVYTYFVYIDTKSWALCELSSTICQFKKCYFWSVHCIEILRTSD
jgi:hypothetical protein